MTIDELRESLSKYAGPAAYTKWPRSRMAVSDGVLCFAKNTSTSWFLDILATEPAVEKMVGDNGYVMAMLSSTGNVTISDETNMLSMAVPHTMCPDGQWQFYLKRTKDKKNKDIFVLLLMTENIKDS